MGRSSASARIVETAPERHVVVVRPRSGVTWVSRMLIPPPLGMVRADIDATRDHAPAAQWWETLPQWLDKPSACTAYALLFGDDADAPARSLMRGPGRVTVVRCADLDDAIGVADRLALPGDTVIPVPDGILIVEHRVRRAEA